MSRRTPLNKETISLVYDLLKEGHYAIDVAEYVGTTQASWYNWMNRGEELHEMEEEELEAHLQSLPEIPRRNAILYLEFFETVKRAETESKMQALRNIRKAGKKSWQAEAWYLERKFRHQFGRVTMLEDSKASEGSGGLLEKMIAGVDAVAQKDDEE